MMGITHRPDAGVGVVRYAHVSGERQMVSGGSPSHLGRAGHARRAGGLFMTRLSVDFRRPPTAHSTV